MTPLAIHRRLVAERQRAEEASARANATRDQLMQSIAVLEQELADRSIDPSMRLFREARLVQQMLELERFKRDVCAPLEELRDLTAVREKTFADQIKMERAFARRTNQRPRLKRP